MRDYYDECLKRWDHPTGFDNDENFVGSKPGGYVIYSRQRESTICENVNFDNILKQLGGESDTVRVIRHRHWACGWIEYITVFDTAPKKMLDLCVDIVRALEEYPILDDVAYGDAVYTAIWDYWDAASLRDKIQLCADAKVSIFAARGGIPDAVMDRLSDNEMFF